MSILRENTADGDDALDVTAADLAAEGLTRAEIDAVMCGSHVITRQEASDRWTLLQRERGVRP